MNHHNFTYTSGVPTFVGDRYYGQDMLRDFYFLLARIGDTLSAITSGSTAKLDGGDVTAVGLNALSVPQQTLLARLTVTIPDDLSSVPGTTQTEDIFVPFLLPAFTNVSFPSATLDGSTTNYVKYTYQETGDPTKIRSRAELSGTYAYEVMESGIFTINSTAPTANEILLCTFVGDGSTFLNITQVNTYNIPATLNSILQLSALSVTGAATVGSATITGDASVGGNLTVTGTVDTGQGATEVFAMNQAVETTDDVTFNSVTSGTLNNQTLESDALVSQFTTTTTTGGSSETDLPIGSVVAVVKLSTDVIQTNESFSIYRANTGRIYSNNMAEGPILSGTWRARGEFAGAETILAQRVS